MSVPPFSLDAARYDQSSYEGRLRHFVEMTDMRTLLTTDAQLQQAIERLDHFKATGTKPDGVSDEEMWKARQTKEAIVHPVTNENMFLPGRMSAFVPVNTIPTAGMLMASTPATMLFWHWTNQTINVVCNYVNRSGAEVNASQLAQAYGLAVGVSCSIAIGASQLVKKGPAIIKKLGKTVPYVAVASAGAANVGFTRWPEVQNGVPVKDKDGRTLGQSKAAAFEAIKLTVLSRNCCLPAVPLLGPPLIMAGLQKLPIVARGGPVAIVTEVTVVSACIAIGLPLAIAVFPQEMTVPTSALEAEFQNLKDAQGDPIDHVYCNKGL